MAILRKSNTIKIGSELKHRRGPIEKAQEKCFYCVMIPYAIFLFLVQGLPFFWGIGMSLTNYTGFNIGNLKFVGFDNFVRVISDNDALASIGRVACMALIYVPISTFVCILLSLMLNERFRGVGIFRTIWYMPSILPGVASVLIWKILFMKNGGLFNEICSWIGIAAIDWLGYEHVRTSLMMMLLWGCSGGILSNIAAIKAIPSSLYEAAEIEGASYITKTFKITLPLISNMIYMSLLNGVIAMLQLFGQPVLLTGEQGLTGVPITPIYTYMVHVYQQIFVNMRFGYGLAMVFLIFLLIVVFTRIMEKTSKLWVFTDTNN